MQGKVKEKTILEQLPEGISNEVFVLSFGQIEVSVYKHGSINEVTYAGEPVTSNRDLLTMLKTFDNLAGQRGGNPFMGPMMPRYDSSKLAQPGPEDIHGFYAGMLWSMSG